MVGVSSIMKEKKQKQRHIAFYIGSLQKGGAERVFLNLAEFFESIHYKVTIVTQRIGENEYPLPAGVNRIMSDLTIGEESRSRILNYTRRISKLRSIWKRIKPDLVLSCIGKNNFQAIESTLGLQTKVVVSVVSDPKREYGTRTMRVLAKTLFGLADGIVLQTKESKEFFPNYLDKKIVIMQNALNPLFFIPRFEGVRDKTIISVGRLDKNKNQAMIIKAFAELSKDYPNYRLFLYGEGEERANLELLIKELDSKEVKSKKLDSKELQTKKLLLKEKIDMPGMIQDVPGTIYQAGIFVLSSYVEGMPNSLLEAMALGIPSISTDCPCGGPKEMIQHQTNGLLVPTGDVKELVKAMKYLLDNPQKTEELGKNACKIQQQLSPDRTNGNWQGYFDTVISGKQYKM